VPYTYTPPVYVPPVQYDMCPNIAGIQSVLPSGYYIQNGYCYQTYIQPPVYQQPVQPYVTLSSVPYTGLELGPVGTALYWGFLVLWCLFAAYMIAVKRVQNTFVAWLTGGKKAHAHTAHVAHAVHAPAHKVEHKAAVQHSGIDPFIASQIGR
jgi:hypothetical protein